MEQARMLRGLVRMYPEDMRIPDPMGKSQSAHGKAVHLVTDAVFRIVQRIVPPR